MRITNRDLAIVAAVLLLIALMVTLFPAPVSAQSGCILVTVQYWSPEYGCYITTYQWQCPSSTMQPRSFHSHSNYNYSYNHGYGYSGGFYYNYYY